MPLEPHLLPRNAEKLEIALSMATDPTVRLNEAVIDMRGFKYRTPLPSFLPYLVYEYGLGELTPYIPNLYDLIDEGIDWQRLRGTPASVFLILGWLGYGGSIEEPSIRRERWNLFQLALNKLRESEDDLPRIEGAAQLSVPVRSYFWRGFYGYDVRALEWSWNSWSNNIWGSYSGVRLQGGQAKWSFGRRYDVDHAMTDDELNDLDVYLPPAGDEPLGWEPIPWPSTPWSDSAAKARSVAMLDSVDRGVAWVVFRNAANAVIGYRRVRSMHRVDEGVTGIFRVGDIFFNPSSSGSTVLYVEAMTDFGDGYGQTAASFSIILKGVPAGSNPIGALWLPAGGLTALSPEIAEQEVDIEFGRTVRERVCAALRF